MALSVQRAQRIRHYGPILERLADDATFLWLMRSQAIAQPHYFRQDIMALDQRIRRHVTALLQAPDDSWTLLTQNLENAESDSCFIAAMLAFSLPDSKKIQQIIEVVLTKHAALPGLISALAYLPSARIHPWIKKFLISKNLDHKLLGIAACSARRDNPQNYLATIIQRSDCQAHEQLLARSLRLAGELKRFDLLPLVLEALQDDREPVRFWAAWSTALLGGPAAVPILRSMALQPGQFQDNALAMVLRIVDAKDGRSLVDELSRLAEPETARRVIQSCATLGDVEAVPWLIQKMHQPEFNRLAAEAFVTITGVDLERQQLLVNSQEWSSGFENEQDQSVFDDEHLPYVDVNRAADFWQRHHTSWQVGQRYFLGRPIKPQQMRDVFSSGNQRQRRMAALHWALLEPAQVLPNYAAMEAVA